MPKKGISHLYFLLSYFCFTVVESRLVSHVGHHDAISVKISHHNSLSCPTSLKFLCGCENYNGKVEIVFRIVEFCWYEEILILFRDFPAIQFLQLETGDVK